MTPSDFLKTYGKEIADAYARMRHTPDSPLTQATYTAFKGELLQQFDSMRQNINVLPWTHSGQPYANSDAMMADVFDNRRLFVYIGGDLPDNHPMLERLTVTHTADDSIVWIANDVFRAVHDYYGHALNRCSFGPVGEECAYRAHRAMFSHLACWALACETRAQSCAFNYGPHADIPRHRRPFPEQKAGILNTFVVFGD